METFSRKKVIFWRGGVSTGLNLEKFSRSQAFKKDDFFRNAPKVVFWDINPWIFFQKNDLKIVFKKVIFWRVGCPQGWNKNSNGGLRVVILKSAWEKKWNSREKHDRKRKYFRIKMTSNDLSTSLDIFFTSTGYDGSYWHTKNYM